ncbi:cytohesin-interacting protein [Hypomesus transpacificus]|uniref:cytohesin-interacting protein n=1 Tax=Hypomesus transpacificus TaxID=137520 RepID=UPI001F0782E4|nr:cytohesin-interacting protein [Hypomesus transpacificus]
MNSVGLQRQDSQDSCILEGSLRQKGRLWYRRSLRSLGEKLQHRAGSPGRTQPRAPRQMRQTSSNSLVDYSDPQRTTYTLEKQDNETYGFDVQTYGVQLRNVAVLEMCTFVCTVQEDSAAECSGLTAGDVIVSINGVSIEGSTHQHIIDLIRESTNFLKVETVCGTVVKRIELEKKMSSLKQTLREKWCELQALGLQEKRLTQGNLNDSCLFPSTDSLVSLMSLSGLHAHRFSSDSSWRSVATEDSDQASVFGDLSSPSPFSAASTTDDSCFFPSSDPQRGGGTRPSSSTDLPRSTINRNRSGSLADSSSLSPSCERSSRASLFGTLPRKGRHRGSVRQLLRFLPGLNRSVEEEDN